MLAVGRGAAPAAPAVRWKPEKGLRWQYQLQGAANSTVCAKPANGRRVRSARRVRDRPLRRRTASTPNTAAVQADPRPARARGLLRRRGHVGELAARRGALPEAAARQVNGWPGERWLDIRATACCCRSSRACAEVREGRLRRGRLRQRRGLREHDRLPADGAPTARVQPRRSPKLAHARGLAVGLKNDLGQLTALQPAFDFAVNEQCFAYKECSAYDGWLNGGKPVVEIEYTGSNAAICATAAAHGRDAMKKALALKATPWTALQVGGEESHEREGASIAPSRSRDGQSRRRGVRCDCGVTPVPVHIGGGVLQDRGGSTSAV